MLACTVPTLSTMKLDILTGTEFLSVQFVLATIWPIFVCTETRYFKCKVKWESSFQLYIHTHCTCPHTPTRPLYIPTVHVNCTHPCTHAHCKISLYTSTHSLYNAHRTRQLYKPTLYPLCTCPLYKPTVHSFTTQYTPTAHTHCTHPLYTPTVHTHGENQATLNAHLKYV